MSEVKVNKISPRSGTDVTLGDSGDTFTIPSGATINNQGTAVNFGATGSASWVTTVKTSTFTAVAGEGYFVNTTGGAVSVNLPAGTAGAVVAVKDYAGTFDTNGCTLVQNGSDKIGGSTDNAVLTTEGIAATLVFIDSTQGWLVTDSGLQDEAPTEYSIDFLVIAGGGGGGSTYGGGGGGAGGFRTSTQAASVGTNITVTVGAGGTNSYRNPGANGGSSAISGTGLTTITSAGGGGGGEFNTPPGKNGGSGGGATAGTTNLSAGGDGNTPSTSPVQGFAGGNGVGSNTNAGAGGGGSSSIGISNSGTTSGNGGNGTANSITGSSVTYAGGGGGASESGTQGTGQAGGGNGSAGQGGDATANTGSGGGGSERSGGTFRGGNGGSGVVILSMPLANFSGTTTGSPTESTSGSNKILTFTGTGSYTT